MRYTGVDQHRFAAQTTLNALVQCVVAHAGRSAVKPAIPAEIPRALGPPTVLVLRRHEDRTIARIGKLVRSLPGYRFERGPDPSEAASVFDGWLNKAERAA
ncbi:MAG: hypothetical protein U1E67_14070 [Hyphomicrobiales bacterium]